LSFEPETAFSALSILKNDASFLLASFLALTEVFSYAKFCAKKPPKKKRAEAERENLEKAEDDRFSQAFKKILKENF